MVGLVIENNGKYVIIDLTHPKLPGQVFGVSIEVDRFEDEGVWQAAMERLLEMVLGKLRHNDDRQEDTIS